MMQTLKSGIGIAHTATGFRSHFKKRTSAPTAAQLWIYRRNIMTKREYIVEVLQQMETAMERLGGTRAEIWQNDIIYCLCRAVWLLMTWELKKL